MGTMNICAVQAKIFSTSLTILTQEIPIGLFFPFPNVSIVKNLKQHIREEFSKFNSMLIFIFTKKFWNDWIKSVMKFSSVENSKFLVNLFFSSIYLVRFWSVTIA